MQRLRAHYGDPRRMARAVDDELKQQSKVTAFDYAGLVGFATKIKSLYSRLKVHRMESELASTSGMTQVLEKVAPSVRQKWLEWRSSLAADTLRSKSEFEHLVDWLDIQKVQWEELSAFSERSERRIQEKPAEPRKTGRVNKVEEKEGKRKEEKEGRTCFECGKPGHLKKRLQKEVVWVQLE